MWALRWIFIAIIVLGVPFISYQNSADVDVRFLKWSLTAIPLYFVIFFSFAIGMISFLIIAFFNQMRHHVQVRKLRGEINQLNKKIIELGSVEADVEYENEKKDSEQENEVDDNNIPS